MKFLSFELIKLSQFSERVTLLKIRRIVIQAKFKFSEIDKYINFVINKIYHMDFVTKRNLFDILHLITVTQKILKSLILVIYS